MIRLNATTSELEQPSLPGLDRPSSPAHQRRFVTRAVDLREPGKPDYVLGASPSERERLLLQCETFKPEARWMLDQIGVNRNWWTIDVGCGPLGILDLLAESTGPGAEVIGLERDPNMLEFGHELMAERGLNSVRLIQGDAHDTGLPRRASISPTRAWCW